MSIESYDKIKQSIREQIKNREFGEMTLKDWNETNRTVRKHLKTSNVRCKGCFYNPKDGRVYIKQTFRNVRIGGLVQWSCTMEDFMLATDNECKGFYLDDPYFAVPYNIELDIFWGGL